MSLPETARSVRRIPAGTSASWVLAGTVINALTTYVLLVVVLRAVTTGGAADFSVFWAVVVIAGLGFFLPIEQETARRVARTGPGRSVARIWSHSARLAARIGVVLVVPVSIFWLVDRQPITALAFVLAAAGYVLQFPSRGVLSGRRRLARYGAVTALDSALRFLMSIVLAVCGVHATIAYEFAVAASAAIAGVAAAAWSRVDRHRRVEADLEEGRFGYDAGRLIVAAACMQALLNSGTLLAKAFAHPDQVALVATLLVTLTIARLPVFVFQSLQATYLTRLTAGVHQRDSGVVRRLLLLLSASVLAIGVGVTVGAAVGGPWVVHTFFGARYQVGRLDAVLVAASVACYLAASVANDVSVAVGAHRRISLAWPSGLVLAAAVALLVPDLALRSILPLAAGSLVALCVLVPGIWSRTHGLVRG